MMPVDKRFFSDSEPFIRLIVNADDLGISEAVNEGIVMAYQNGIVTAASLMATGRAFDHAVSLIRSCPMLDIGCHLTLVAEKPLLKQDSSLTGKDGRFPEDIRTLAAHLLMRRIYLPDVKAEWSAQIERILDNGIRVVHLDSHQHVHVLPGILGLSFELGRKYHIPFIRRPVENRWVAGPLSLHGMIRMAGAMAVRASCGIAGLFQKYPSSFTVIRFLGFYEGGCLDEAGLERILRYLKPGRVYELMCHPGLTPAEPDIANWHYSHLIEMNTLTGRKVRSLMEALHIRLCRFTDIAFQP